MKTFKVSRRGLARKAILYTLPHEIEIIGEYKPNYRLRYWRCRVRSHSFFSAPNISGGQYVRRSRVVMASMLGRRLGPKEYVHHKNGGRSDDRPKNLELMSAGDHNRLHKKGTKHRTETKKKISAGLKQAYAEGRKVFVPSTRA